MKRSGTRVSLDALVITMTLVTFVHSGIEYLRIGYIITIRYRFFDLEYLWFVCAFGYKHYLAQGTRYASGFHFLLKKFLIQVKVEVVQIRCHPN